MVEGARTGAKPQASANNKSFSDQNQTKIVLRRLPPTLTSEQFLEIVSPLPDHDYYRFCKPDYSLGQHYSFCRAYLNIPNRQDLIVFTEKFQGYVFVDKNGTEYNCSVEYAPNQTRSKAELQSRKDPKVNSFEQDPEYQAFVANMNAPLSASEALPSAETNLEEIEKKQRDIQESKHKSGLTSTPLLDFLKRRRDEKKQEKLMRIQQNTQRRNNKQSSRNNAATLNEDEYNSSMRYGGGGGDRANRQQRGYEKSEYRNSAHDQKRPNAGEYAGGKQSKNRDSQQNPKLKQQQSAASKEPKTILSAKSNAEESVPTDNPPKREVRSAEASNTTATNENTQSEDRPRSSNKPSSGDMQKNPNAPPKNRPSIQIYNPGEKARLRKQQNPPS